MRERHADLKGDPRFLGNDPNRTDFANRCNYDVKERADRRRLAFEMMGEVVPGAGVRLIAVRKSSPTLFTTPERPSSHQSAPLFLIGVSKTIFHLIVCSRVPAFVRELEAIFAGPLERF